VHWLAWLLVGILALVVFGAFARWLLQNPRGTVDAGLIWRTTEIYTAVVHRVRVEGAEHIPLTRAPGPLIVVLNHTAGIDPLLAQSVVPFEIRWIMMTAMRVPALEWFWRFANVIFVDQEGGVSGAREAIRHVKAGGVIGIFPEGGIERPREHILPFEPGVGFLIRRTGARVLPVIIDGTPPVDPAWASLIHRSRSRVRFMPPIDYGSTKMSAQEIAQDLRRRYMEWTGWPAADATPKAPPGSVAALY
jgi:1-acyl-sn-glycerol-3-phosphate acyltransferase